jgi:CheY-like chemotaxis protein
MVRPSRIMIVKDHQAEPFPIREAFMNASWKAIVEEVQSGERTIDALRRNRFQSRPPDLVILDCHLHGETSLDTVKTIRAYPSYRCQSIIVLSSIMPTVAIIRECFYFDVLLVLEKPDNYPDLVSLIKQLKAHFVQNMDLTTSGSWKSEQPGNAITAQPDMQLGF